MADHQKILQGDIGAFISTYAFFLGGVLITILVKWAPQNPILIIKGPNIEPYYRSFLEPFKDPFKGTLF